MMITPTVTLIRFLRGMADQTMKKDDKVACALGEAADRLEFLQKSLNIVDEEITALSSYLDRKDAVIANLRKQIAELTKGEK
jgi:septal ring factor EnvC (AmiA/AmiB activator)